MEPAATLGLVLSLLTASLYGYVGVILMKREARGPSRRALLLFSVWWFCLGGTSAMGALRTGLLMLGVDDLDLHVALSLASVLVLVVGLFSLLYYLLYLHLGRESLMGWLAAAYFAIFVYFVYLSLWLDPQAVRLDGWQAETVNGRMLVGGHLWAALLLLLAPTVLAAALYGSLFFRLEDPEHRYRIALVSGSFILWFGGLPVIGLAFGLSDEDWWRLLSRFVGLLIPLLIIAAYRPPAWVRKRLDARGART